MKTHEFSTVAAMLKHYRRVHPRRKRSYIKAFLRRYSKLLRYLEVARVYIYSTRALKEINRLLHELEPALVIVDDRLYGSIRYSEKRMRREGEAKRRYEEFLKKVADNLANYFRILLEENPGRFSEQLKRLEK